MLAGSAKDPESGLIWEMISGPFTNWEVPNSIVKTMWKQCVNLCNLSLFYWHTQLQPKETWRLYGIIQGIMHHYLEAPRWAKSTWDDVRVCLENVGNPKLQWLTHHHVPRALVVDGCSGGIPVFFRTHIYKFVGSLYPMKYPHCVGTMIQPHHTRDTWWGHSWFK